MILFAFWPRFLYFEGMRRALCSSLKTARSKPVEIPESEAKHLVSVMRLGPGDEIELLDGMGFRANARLLMRDKKVFGELSEEPGTDPARCSLPIRLHLAILKGDAMEWVIEKAVELGVRTLVPVETEFTVVKIHKKGADAFRERWQRIADQALKQCGRLDRMEIAEPVSFEQLLLDPTPMFWLDETLAHNGPGESHLASLAGALVDPAERALLVGPEGGLSPTERGRLLQLTGSAKKVIKRAHLGSLILRAETAALFGVSLLVGGHHGKK
jgi:16S rRNA (uracil1498-N3)-methyltransferase